MTLEPCSCGQPAMCAAFGNLWAVSCDAFCSTTEYVILPSNVDACEIWNRHRRLDRLAADKVKEWAGGKPVDAVSFEYADNGVIVKGSARHYPGYHFRLVVEEK